MPPGENWRRPTAGHDDFAAYRTATIDLLRGFQVRRLEAIEHITQTFTGNKQNREAGV